MAAPLVFVSYSHKDEDWKNRLVEHLSVTRWQDLLDVWDDRRIHAGENWRQKIEEALSRAKIAILLISKDFLNSDFIQSEEIKIILERQRIAGLQIVPIIARHCLWKYVPWLEPLNAMPKDGTPLFGMLEAQQEEALVAIATEVIAILEATAVEQGKVKSQTFRGSDKTRETGDVVSSQEGEGEAELGRATRQTTKHEYELLEELWNHSLERQPISMDRLLLQSVAVLGHQSGYPWSVRELREAGFDDQALIRLIRRGLLRLEAARGVVELAQPRMLPWTVAAGLIASWCTGEINDEALVQQGLACLSEVTNPGQPWLGDAVPDLLWQLAGADGTLHATVALLAALEDHHPGEIVVTSAWRLGSRLLPALFERLQAHAANENSWSIRYLEILRNISREESSLTEIGSRALIFLQNANMEFQEIGVSILAFAPTATALGPLWQILCSEQDENSLPLQKQLADALAACARQNPGWVETRLLESDPSREPLKDLVFLLLQIDSGEEIWLRHRDTILQKVSGPGDRPIAYCVFQFRDRSMIEWLRSRIFQTEDLVGPAALRALLLLEPETVLPQPGGESVSVLLSTRGWWFPLYLTANEPRAHSWALALLENHPNPWWIATIYSRFETWMPKAFVESLLHQAEQLLASEAAKPTDGKGLNRPLRTLAAIHRRELLYCFERRRGSSLEDNLADFLIRLGPNDSRWARHVDDDGLAVLLKIGGQGYARVAASYLRGAVTPLGKRLAMDLITRGIQAEGLDFLTSWVATIDVKQSDDEVIFTGMRALSILAMAGRFKELVEGVIKFGLKIPRDLELYLEGVFFSDLDLAPALVLFNGPMTPPGAVLAVGLGHRSDLAPQVRAILQVPDSPSELIIAGLLCLNLLNDDSPEAEALLLAQLPRQEMRFAASRGLLRLAHRPVVWAALMAEIARLGDDTPSTSFDPLPGDLLDKAETRVEAARILWGKYSRFRLLFFVGDLVEHFSVLGEEA
ncbi:MAG TPA: toll/interleukin-1 receptor domain-containing protein, partial [Thermoanaerobaculia bacterium]